MYFDQAWESQIDKFIDTSAVEVGMFIQNLSSYLLEKDIDVSYTSCFYRDIKKSKTSKEAFDHFFGPPKTN